MYYSCLGVTLQRSGSYIQDYYYVKSDNVFLSDLNGCACVVCFGEFALQLVMGIVVVNRNAIGMIA